MVITDYQTSTEIGKILLYIQVWLGEETAMLVGI